MKYKVKPPHPPRFLCNNALQWSLGIVSPSRLLNYNCGAGTEREQEKMKLYNERVRAYQLYIWEQRVAARSVTKEEWRYHCRRERIEAREQLAQKQFNEQLQKIIESAQKAAANIGAALAKAGEEIAKQIELKMGDK